MLVFALLNGRVAAARLALSDVFARLSPRLTAPLPGRRQLSSADSLTLRQLARTPGGTAETAALWFNYLYPAAGVRTATLRPVLGKNAAATAQAAPVQSFFPNPAADQLRVSMNTPNGNAVLRLTNLLSGKLVLETALPPAEEGRRDATVNVRNLPAGQYAATVVVDGVPVTTQRLIINR